MTKITLIGAGSTIFAKNLIGDILSYSELSDVTLCLFDIDAKRLELSERVAHRIAAKLGAHPKIVATTHRLRALENADYAINMIQVGGYRPATVIDFEIPKRYGLQQTIGDTLGIGGIMRALRTLPVLLEMTREMEAVCPDVLHLNYVNPMAINCLALARASDVKTVGLCHSVQSTARELARDVGVPGDEVEYLCAGINHMAFYLRLEHDGQDLYPKIREAAASDRVPDWNRVRYDVFRRFGYFVTESSEHFSEYVPWYIKKGRPDLLDTFNIPIDEYLGRCEVQEAAWHVLEAELREPLSQTPETLRATLESKNIAVTSGVIDHSVREFANLDVVHRSLEYGAAIIHSLETGQPRVVYGNVLNRRLIDNLPESCCVEVPCLVDHNGVQPVKIGQLPLQLAALLQTNINVQMLTAEAALTGRREHVYHAALLDPHTAADLDPEEITSLVDELLVAHGLEVFLP